MITEHDTVDGGGGAAPHATCPLPPIGHFPCTHYSGHWSWSRLSKTVQKVSQHLIMCLIIHVMRNMESVSKINDNDHNRKRSRFPDFLL